MGTISIINTELWQWDLNRKISLIPGDNEVINEVHFADYSDGSDALVVSPVYTSDGTYEASIPNILLQSGANIHVYAMQTENDGIRVLFHRMLFVNRRERPSDYLYEETDILAWYSLDERVKKLENGGTVNPVYIDATLKTEGAAADAKAVGDALEKIPNAAQLDGTRLVMKNNTDTSSTELFDVDLSSLQTKDVVIPQSNISESDPGVYDYAKQELFAKEHLIDPANRNTFITIDGVEYYRYHCSADNFEYVNPAPKVGSVTIAIRTMSQYTDGVSSILIYYEDGSYDTLKPPKGTIYSYTTDSSKTFSKMTGNYDLENWNLIDMSVMSIRANYIQDLPFASSTNTGGVRADTATEEDTQPVRMGTDGRLYTAAAGSGEISDEKIASAIEAYLSENPIEGVTQEEIEQAVSTYLTENPIEGVTDEQVAAAVDAYLTENPVDGVTDEQISSAVNDYLTENPVEAAYYFEVSGSTLVGTTYAELRALIDDRKTVYLYAQNESGAVNVYPFGHRNQGEDGTMYFVSDGLYKHQTYQVKSDGTVSLTVYTFVVTGQKINGKQLSSNITLTDADIADADGVAIPDKYALKTEIPDAVTDEQIADAVETYLTENPVEGVTDAQIESAVENYLTENPVEGGDGKDGVSVTHEWDGTTLVITSASGTSSADLKGEKGDSANVGKDVLALLGVGTSSAPIDLSTIGITEFTTVYFPRGTYYVSPLTLSGVSNVTFCMRDAEIIVKGDYFINATNCPYFTVIGGKITGANLYGIKITTSEDCTFDGITFVDIGGASYTDVSALSIFGKCDRFRVTDCKFDSITSGTVASDGYIHAYGVFVNRLSSNNTYSASGIIENCYFYYVQGTDSGSVKADGDGIFIQIPPYTSGTQTIIRDVNIVIRNCGFYNCKKRGIKSAAHGVTIEHCTFDGAYWYAPIDVQYGHNIIRDCAIENTSDYTESATAGIVMSDGGSTIERCTIYAQGHPAIRTTERLPGSVITADTAWDNIRIADCYFEGCTYGVMLYNSGTTTYTLDGLDIIRCRFGAITENYGIRVSATAFPTINTFRFVDFSFDYGKNRTDVKNTLTNFVYPILFDFTAVVAFELYSAYWYDEPMSSYSNLPTAHRTRVVYESADGLTMGGIYYKLYTSHGSEIVGSRAPSAITATLGKQLLYNSKVGDRYRNKSDGTVYVCTAAGDASSIGTWTETTASTGDLEDGNGVAY